MEVFKVASLMKYANFYLVLTPPQKWHILSIFIAVYGVFAQFLPNITPNFCLAIFRYGKSKQGLNPNFISDLMSVPKSWFTHFYLFGSIYYSFLLWSSFRVFFRREECPVLLSNIIQVVTPSPIKTKVLPEDLVIAIILIALQVVRRLYECLYVHAKSNARMSIFHYAYGVIFYFAVGLSLLVEAPGFRHKSSTGDVVFTGAWLTPNHVSGVALFIFGWCIQFDSHLIFANLRKPAKGKMSQYSIPFGGFFQYVSCPHYLGEIIMYLAILIVFGAKNQTWLAVSINVVVNQIFAALMSHAWYKTTFKTYPKDRKAIIPFIL